MSTLGADHHMETITQINVKLKRILPSLSLPVVVEQKQMNLEKQMKLILHSGDCLTWNFQLFTRVLFANMDFSYIILFLGGLNLEEFR